MKVFITGGTGFIGTLVVPELIAYGHSVVGLARSESSTRKLRSLGSDTIQGDIEDLDLLRNVGHSVDAIIHCAFIHDFDADNHDLMRNMRKDCEALMALAEGIRGTTKVLLNTNESLATENGVVLREATEKATWWERRLSEDLFKKLASEGVNVRTVRLPCVTHGADDHHGFITTLVNHAKEHGESVYVADGSQHWPSVNKLGVAAIYRLAIEMDLPKGQALHPYEDEVLTIREIAQAIGKKLKVPTKSITPEEAIQYFGFIGRCMALDNQAAKEETVELTGWKPVGLTLLEDIEQTY